MSGNFEKKAICKQKRKKSANFCLKDKSEKSNVNSFGLTRSFLKIKMSDFDLYEDILTAKDQSKDDQITPEEIEKLQKEVEDTRKKFKRLMEINCDLKAECNKLQSNLSTLMMTCRAEINRKNDTIAGKVNHNLESHSEND